MSDQLPLIDQAYYAHIIDAIFAAASPTALLAMRVNQEWRQLAERRVAYHVCVTSRQVFAGGKGRTIYTLRAGDRTVLGSFSDLVNIDTPTKRMSIASLPPIPQYIVHTRVLDLFINDVPRAVMLMLLFVRPTVVVRCHAALSALSGTDTLATFDRTACVVLFNDTIVRDVRTDKLVYHCTTTQRVGCNGDGTGSCWVAMRDMLRFAGELVVHFDAGRWLRSRHGPRPALLTPICRHVGVLGDLILAAHMLGIRTTVVGFDFDPYRPENLPEDLGDLTTALKQLFQTYIQGRGDGELRYLSQSEYAAEVGAEQYRIETFPGPIAYPEN